MNTSPPKSNSAPSQMTSILAPDWYGLPPTKVETSMTVEARELYSSSMGPMVSGSRTPFRANAHRARAERTPKSLARGREGSGGARMLLCLVFGVRRGASWGLLRARRGLAPENARVGNVFGIGEAAQVLGPLLAGRVALPAPPLGRERGFGFWLAPRGQVLHRQPPKILGGLAGMLSQP